MAHDTEVDRLIVRILADSSQLKTEFANLGKHIDDTTSSWSKSFDSFGKSIENSAKQLVSLRGIAGALGVGFGVGELANFTRALMTSAEEITNQAKVLGISTDALQAYHAAAVQAGAGADVGDEAIRRFTRSIGEAKAGSATLNDVFGELHITGEDLAGGAEGALPKVAASLLQIESASARARVETVLFGRSGQVVEQLLRAWADPDIVQNMKNIGLVIDKEILARVAQLDEEWNRVWLHAQVDGMETIDYIVRSLKAVVTLTPAPGSVLDLWMHPPTALRTPQPAAMGLGLPAITNNATFADSVKFTEGTTPVKAFLDDEAAQAKFDLQVRESQNAFLKGWKFTTAAAGSDWNDYLAGKIGRLEENSRRIVANAQQLAALEKQTTEDEKFVESDIINKAYQKQIDYADQLRSSLNIVGAVGVMRFSSIGDALAQMGRQLASTILQLEVMKPLMDSLMGPAGTPFGGLLGSIFGAATGLPFPASVDIGDIPGRAGGGSVSAGQPYWVGERGPELFMPDVSGRISPSGSSSVQGATQIIVTVLPSPLFATTVDQRLAAGAPKIVGAAVQATQQRSRNSGGR